MASSLSQVWTFRIFFSPRYISRQIRPYFSFFFPFLLFRLKFKLLTFLNFWIISFKLCILVVSFARRICSSSEVVIEDGEYLVTYFLLRETSAIYGRERLARNSRGARSHPQVDTRGYARVRFHGQATGDRAHALVTPICLLLASAERKRSGCLPLAFRHTPTRALALPLAKHVPNLEQRRRHANPWDISAQTRRLFPRRSVD